VDRDLNRGQEVPALQWAQVAGRAGDRRAGCLMLNDSKYGHALDGSTLALTLIRGSCEPDPLPEVRQHEVHVALRPFADDLPVAEAVRAGRAFNHALRVVGTGIHEGPLPATAALIAVEPPSVILNSVKQAETGDGLVLQFFDPTGTATRAKAVLDRGFLGPVKGAAEVDLLERPVAQSSAKVQGSAVSVALPARGIASVLVRFGASGGRR
jgi:alpha-mannosidase